MWTELLIGCSLTITTAGAVFAHFLSLSRRMSVVPIDMIVYAATPSLLCAFCWANLALWLDPHPPGTWADVFPRLVWNAAVLVCWACYAYFRFWRIRARWLEGLRFNEEGIPMIRANVGGDRIQLPPRVRRPSIVEGARPAEPETYVVCLGRPAACTGHPCGHAVLCERCMWDWREHSPGAGCVYCTQPLDRIEIPAD